MRFRNRGLASGLILRKERGRGSNVRAVKIENNVVSSASLRKKDGFRVCDQISHVLFVFVNCGRVSFEIRGGLHGVHFHVSLHN